MQPLYPAHAEEVLTQLTHHFAQWRQSRPTPRSRIPTGLWARAVALTATFSISRVANQLGPAGVFTQKVTVLKSKEEAQRSEF